jgi:NADPH-dependent 2,4-dienoyl-CoA reductase/sulfur reductase-like enzyme/rhodanese-related sulfurtransferase
MSNKIVIIGGTACGPKAAARARRCDQQAQITLVEQQAELSVATCGLPYYVSGVVESRLELVQRGPDFFKDVMDIEVLTRTRAVGIDRKARRVEVLNLAKNRTSTIEYDKLVLATGSTPLLPDWPGKELKGIFSLSRIEEAQAMRDLVSPRKIDKAVIIGAGLIGLEMAEALVSQGVEVTVVEALDWPLPTLLDFEVAAYLDKHLAAKGVKRLFGQRVSGFEGDEKGWLSRVLIGDKAIEADLALVAIGVRPNIGLANDAGLSIGETGGIAVNTQLQTSDPDIYAGGDCVENVNLITGQKTLVPLGSTANKHGRVIGTNVTGGDEGFPGIVGTGIAKVFDYNVGHVGLSQSQAQAAGYEVITSLVPGYEHATYYPRGKEILVKLVAEKANGRLLGGQVVGPGDADKRIDVLATALTFSATVDDLANIDLGYAPPYNSALDPLHNAANVIRNKQEGFARALTPMEVAEKLRNNDDFIFLDVRSPGEWEAYRIEAPQDKFLPLRELRARLAELPKDAEIVIVCHTSVRAYQAQRILDGAGFKYVKFLDGSIAAWPYEISFQRPTSSSPPLNVI